NGPLDAPASVDPHFLLAFIDLLRNEGYKNLAVAEASGRSWAPTEKVVAQKGLLPDLKRRDVPFYALDDMQWRAVETGGDALPRVHLPTILEEFDRLVFLPNLKTHGDAGFTLTIKLAMGLTPLADRDLFHRGSVPAAIADLARVVKPDLSIIDGRTAFVSGGPDTGTLVHPGLALASGDPVALDIEAVRILLQYGAGPHIGTPDPLETETIRRMGSRVPQEIQIRWV
ncbi:MAG: DUF362 domain-containing protein, partial [Clostridia bacterium]